MTGVQDWIWNLTILLGAVVSPLWLKSLPRGASVHQDILLFQDFCFNFLFFFQSVRARVEITRLRDSERWVEIHTAAKCVVVRCSDFVTRSDSKTTGSFYLPHARGQINNPYLHTPQLPQSTREPVAYVAVIKALEGKWGEKKGTKEGSWRGIYARFLISLNMLQHQGWS